jgi:hypothetical protein
LAAVLSGAEFGVAEWSFAERPAVDSKLAAVKMVAVRLSVVKARRAAVSKKRAVQAQRLIERDDRNVRKTRRKEARRSWCKIPAWCDP